MDQQIGRYQILEEIASGGQGAVYRVFDPDTGQIVALKVLHASLSNDSSYVERFRREASLAASIDHPNVVKIFEVGQDGDQHFMALELLPESLARVIEGGGQMRLDRVAEFGVQIADGLAEAHALGIVHRDIKPQNILLGPDGVAKVTDFGIARSEALTSMTATGAVMGTPHYMSPEQSRGEEADARSDVYSLGCMLYQMVSGELPFKGNTPLAVIRQQIDDEPTPIRELRGDLTPGLESVVQRAMAKDAGQRYQTVADMAEALRAAVPGLAGRARAATAPKAPTPPDPPRERETAATPRPSPVRPRDGARKLSRLRSLVRISAAVVLLLWGVFLFAPASGQASKGELIVAILFAASGVTTVSAAFLMLRRTKFKIGNLGWGPLAALLAVMGFVLFMAANGAGPEAATIPEGGPEAVALVPAPAPTATPTMTQVPNATPPSVIAPAVRPSPSPTRTPSPAQSSTPIVSAVETPVSVVVAPATATGTPTSTPTPVPPTATPAASPVSGRIAFVSDRDGNHEIYVMNADGTPQVNLTNDRGHDYWPAWSPDGSKIAFMSNRDDNRTYEIYVMNADGSGVTRLSITEGSNLTSEMPAWSPDGARIAFMSTRNDNRSEIYVMNADGSGLTRLTNEPRFSANKSPAWSPEGTEIAFTASQAGKDEIFVMAVDGSNIVNLTNDPANDRFPSWSPDDSKIAFESDRSSHTGVYVMNADGSNQVLLTRGLGDYSGFPSWSPDGSKITFTVKLTTAREEIYVMNADGSGRTRLTENAAEDFQPSWSPIASAVESPVPAPAVAAAPNATATPIAATVVPPTIALTQAPDFGLETFAAGGRVIRLSEFRGAPVVVAFWFPSLPGGGTYATDLQDAFRKYQPEGVKFVGVQQVGLDTVEDGRQFVRWFGITFPVGADETGSIVEAYNVRGFPTTVFLDKDQNIVNLWVGKLGADRLDDLIQGLLR